MVKFSACTAFLHLILLTVFSIGPATTVHAQSTPQEVLRVTVRRPGTLAEQVGEDRKFRTTSLTIEGVLNGSDLRFLREMAGSDYYQQPTAGRLRTVDLSRATYARGGAPYIMKDEAQYVSSGANTLPNFLFRGCKTEHIVLPERMDTIGIGAFEHSALKNIRIPEQTVLREWAFNHCESLTEVEFPEYLVELGQNCFRECSSLRKMILHNVQFIPYKAFENVTGLEELIIDGIVSHVDGWLCNDCPRLRRIEFSGNLLSSGGPPIASRCPNLSDITFSGVCLSTSFGSVEDCPMMQHCNVTGYVVSSQNPDFIPPTKDSEARELAPLLRRAADDLCRLADTKQPMSRYGQKYTMEISRFIPHLIAQNEKASAMKVLRMLAETDYPYVQGIDMSRISTLSTEKGYKEVMEKLRRNADFRTILRLSPPYDTGAAYRNAAHQPAAMEYATVEDSALQRIRQYFRADYIAGSGDEVERLKNVMYWVHDRIRHRGDFFPNTRRSAIELFEGCRAAGTSPGMNARGQAIVLAELYLSLGWPARFITCESKYNKIDPDATVVTAVWSFSLGKWIMMDASNAAYVCDENGLLLHPGEIRQRIKDGRPLKLNKEANWNFREPETHETYLDYYMAKNLYYLSGYRCNLPGIESSQTNEYYTLSPEGEQPNIGITTYDDAWFWQSPF